MVDAVLNVGLFAALVLFIVGFSTWAARGPAIWGSPPWLIRGTLFSGAIELRRPRYESNLINLNCSPGASASRRSPLALPL